MPSSRFQRIYAHNAPVGSWDTPLPQSFWECSYIVAQRLLRADTETEAIERALVLVIAEHEKSRLALAANDRFVKSGVEIKDTDGTFEDQMQPVLFDSSIYTSALRTGKDAGLTLRQLAVNNPPNRLEWHLFCETKPTSSLFSISERP
jgi:hypothetical protein